MLQGTLSFPGLGEGVMPDNVKDYLEHVDFIVYAGVTVHI